MPQSAQKSSLSSTSGACCSGLTGSPYWMKYGFSRSSLGAAAEARTAIFHMTSRSSTPAAVMTIGLVVLLTMARKHSRYEA